MRDTRGDTLAEVASMIAQVQCPHPTRVAIDGVDAAGKTTLADELAVIVERLARPVVRASIDGFHNPSEIRRRRGSLSPVGYFQDSFDHTALLEELLGPLGPGGSRAFRRAVFNHRTDTRVEARIDHAPADAVLLFDGCSCFAMSFAGTSIVLYSCAPILQ
jgi:uridine kinase